MDVVALTFASGWASGINAYATVFLLGMIGRFGAIPWIPEGFVRTDVLVIMGILALAEFFADKIPYLDSAWDAVSTFIRPVAGALIGALLAGASGDLLPMTMGALQRQLALSSPTLTGAIDRMEAQKLVHRVPNPADGRAWLLEPEPAANRKRTKIEATLESTDDKCFATLSASERKELGRLLAKCIAGME